MREVAIDADTRPPRQGWAPGSYSGECCVCGDHFIGDKRAIMCARCAYIPTLPETYAMACMWHSGQVDKTMRPYIGHPIRVAAIAETLGGTHDVVKAAVLHDVVEDCGITLYALEKMGFSEATVAIVRAVSKNFHTDVTYLEWMRRIRDEGPPGAVTVKLADLTDNTDPSRAFEGCEKLYARYEKAKNVLRGVIK